MDKLRRSAIMLIKKAMETGSFTPTTSDYSLACPTAYRSNLKKIVFQLP